MADDPITAVLDLLAQQAEQLRQLDTTTATVADDSARLRNLAALARDMDQRITDLAERLDQIAPQDTAGSSADRPYTPAPARRWWKLDGPERDLAVRGLRGWVEQVYRPGYGQLAAALGPCWEQHALCLYALDILAELWSVLYLAGRRTAGIVSMQAEYQSRVLPALAEQMATETSRCRHPAEHPQAAGQQRRTS